MLFRSRAGRLKDRLVYHPAYCVLVFRTYGYPLSDLGSHLAEKNDEIKLRSRKAIVKKPCSLEPLLASGTCPAARQTHGSAPIEAVDSLKVHDVLVCLECGFLSISRKRLKVHCKEEHSCITGQGL